MSIGTVLQLIGERSLSYCREMHEISKPLLNLEIDSFSYSVFQDLSNDCRIRTQFFYSDENLLQNYSSKIDKLSDAAFAERKPYPFQQNTYFNYMDEGYSCQNDEIIKITKAYGIRNTIVINHRNPFTGTTENYCFYSHCDKPDWFVEQVNRLASLLKFSLYFRNEGKNFFNKPLVKKDEIKYLSELNEKHYLERRNWENDIFIDKYHFGYPFHKPLTQREFEVIKQYFIGKTSKNISNELQVSVKTVEKIIENVRLKTDCFSLKALKQQLFHSPLFCNLILV